MLQLVTDIRVSLIITQCSNEKTCNTNFQHHKKNMVFISRELRSGSNFQTSVFPLCFSYHIFMSSRKYMFSEKHFC